MDLLPFQEGADASNEKESDYLDVDLDGELIDGVKLEVPEADDDLILTNPDDRPGQVHTTEISNAHLAAAHHNSDVSAQELETDKLQPQAIELSCDTCEVLLVPDIEFEFGDEPIIEISSYY